MDLQSGWSAWTLATSTGVVLTSHCVKTLTFLRSHMDALFIMWGFPFHHLFLAPSHNIILKLKTIAFLICVQTFPCYVQASLFSLGVPSGGNPSVEMRVCCGMNAFVVGLSWYQHPWLQAQVCAGFFQSCPVDDHRMSQNCAMLQ